MRVIIKITCILFLPLFSFAQKNIESNAIDSIFIRKWKLISIDSCGNNIKFPNGFSPIVIFDDFKNKSRRKTRWDRYYRKKGYAGRVYVFSNGKTSDSKYWCNIKAYYKIDESVLTLFWDDNFKVQENFNSLNEKLSYYFLVGMNAKGNAVISKNTLQLKMNRTFYKNEPICISFILQND